MNVFMTNTLENHIPMPGVTHADETITATAAGLAVALNAQTKMVLVTPNVAMRVTFDGTTPVAEGHGHLVQAGQSMPLNRVAAGAMKQVKEYATDAESILTVTELTR
jgi:hypothetical protein